MRGLHIENGDRHRIDLYGTSEASEDMVFGIGVTRTFRHLSRPRICILRVTGILEGILTPLTPSSFRGAESTLFLLHHLVFPLLIPLPFRWPSKSTVFP
jgi:hypothetical protein